MKLCHLIIPFASLILHVASQYPVAKYSCVKDIHSVTDPVDPGSARAAVSLIPKEWQTNIARTLTWDDSDHLIVTNDTANVTYPAIFYHRGALVNVGETTHSRTLMSLDEQRIFLWPKALAVANGIIQRCLVNPLNRRGGFGVFNVTLYDNELKIPIHRMFRLRLRGVSRQRESWTLKYWSREGYHLYGGVDGLWDDDQQG